jgi:hypothetical protein
MTEEKNEQSSLARRCKEVTKGAFAYEKPSLVSAVWPRKTEYASKLLNSRQPCIFKTGESFILITAQSKKKHRLVTMVQTPDG